MLTNNVGDLVSGGLRTLRGGGVEQLGGPSRESEGAPATLPNHRCWHDGWVSELRKPVRLVVHGHFYQPPREDPWTEEVPVEPSAAPFHDWNERITAEAYRPNGWARVVDDSGRVRDVVNDYAHLSVDVGPTLTSWLARHHPEVLARMVEGDRAFGGAIAQAYNHMILPLATERDVRTQVRWGLADFAHRFGRRAGGLWLPECAVDDAVLAVLAEEGVRFTILAPGQAAAVRLIDSPGGADDGWLAVDAGTVSTGAPHRWRHPTRPELEVAVVFYDGAISHDLAFALSGLSSRELVDRVEAAGADGRPVVVATDGESFGHHHRWAERSLAYAFAHELPARGVRVTHLGELVAEQAPTHEVRVHRSAWSCAHGVGRWERDCGCSTGGEAGWTQSWRAPLRRALDRLRDHAVEVFERRGGAVLADPWAARDAYVDVLLEVVTPEAFVATHGRPGASVVEVLTLLEVQRQAMLAYTSCGWFFNDLAGIETVQVLRYAARCADLLDELGDPAPMDEMLATLTEARSNRSDEGSGADVWRRHVEPARIGAERVVAHLALLDLLERRAGEATVGGHEVVAHDRRPVRRGDIVGAAGRVVLRHRRTRREGAYVYAAVRLGGLEVLGAVRPADEARDDDCFDAVAVAAGGDGRITTVLNLVLECFGPTEFGLEAALPDRSGDIVATAATGLAERFAGAIDALWDDHRGALAAFATAGLSLPTELRAPAEIALGRRLRAALQRVAAGDDPVAAVAEAHAVAGEAAHLGVVAAGPVAVGALAAAVDGATARALAADTPTTRTAAVIVVVDLIWLRQRLDIAVDLDRPQERLVAALRQRPTHGGDELFVLADALGVATD